MHIMWDGPKRELNIEKHGFDFAELEPEFFEQAAVILPAREGRLMAIDWFRNTPIAVVFRRLGDDAVSVISMRRASQRERRYL
jgi:uncharacterized DUF497 family protein